MHSCHRKRSSSRRQSGTSARAMHRVHSSCLGAWGRIGPPWPGRPWPHLWLGLEQPAVGDAILLPSLRNGAGVPALHPSAPATAGRLQPGQPHCAQMLSGAPGGHNGPDVVTILPVIEIACNGELRNRTAAVPAMFAVSKLRKMATVNVSSWAMSVQGHVLRHSRSEATHA
jgi:hypothetical protein